ncbi:hypothetical protein [Streptomyces sp. NPDC003480]
MDDGVTAVLRRIAQALPYAVAVGIAMHAAFSWLKPQQLVTFSGLTVGTNLAFAV